jgi:integrase
MVLKREGSKNWWYKFVWKGELIRESTKQTNKRVAEQIEAAHKTRLAKGEVGIVDSPTVPTLAAFTTDTFIPYVRVQKADKPATVLFYEQRAESLLKDKTIRALSLDQVEADHLTAFKAKRRATGYSVSTVNRDLATLRRILHVAVEQKVIAALPLKIKLLGGENKREYVLSEQIEPAYLAACEPLMYHVALVMIDCALRPDEIHRLRWNDHVRNDAIEVHFGKGAGTRRRVEMTERLVSALATWKQTQEAEAKKSKLPKSAWVFPAPTKAGHIDANSYRDQHKKAMKGVGIDVFVPYSLRHTCLTRWAVAGMDAPALQYLAGHKNIATTMKYIHLAQTDVQSRLAEIRRKMKTRVVPISDTVLDAE